MTRLSDIEQRMRFDADPEIQTVMVAMTRKDVLWLLSEVKRLEALCKLVSENKCHWPDKYFSTKKCAKYVVKEALSHAKEGE